jgi:hypothetical protein
MQGNLLVCYSPNETPIYMESGLYRLLPGYQGILLFFANKGQSEGALRGLALKGGKIFGSPPRTRLAKASLLLVLTGAFIVRGNMPHLFGQHPLSGCCYWVTPSEQTGQAEHGVAVSLE